MMVGTNVVSEPIRQLPNLDVRDWSSSWGLDDISFSAVGEAELRYGISNLAQGPSTAFFPSTANWCGLLRR